MAPSKHPRDGAKILQRGRARTARRTRTNAAGFNDVNRGGLTEKIDELRRTDKTLIRFARELREAVHDFTQGNVIGLEIFIEQRVLRDAGRQQLEVIHRGDMVGVLLRDTLALFGHTELTVNTTRRQSVDEAVRGASATGDGPAPAMEEDDTDAMLGTHSRQVQLGAIEIPERGEDTTILIGVGIADHDLLGEAIRDASIATHFKRPTGHRMREEGI